MRKSLYSGKIFIKKKMTVKRREVSVKRRESQGNVFKKDDAYKKRETAIK